MKSLNKKAFAGLLQLTVILSLCLFLPVWTIKFWQAWVFLHVFSLSALFITLYLMKKDPKLLERRVKAGPVAEKEKNQQVIQILATVAFLTIVIFPSVDHRFGWSSVPVFAVIIGDILVALGFYLVFLVFRENTFTSAIIEVAEGQTIISTGPYAVMRHPMYFGALILLIGMPIALGSWWGLLTIIPITAVLVFRLLDEEVFLLKNLPGYSIYQQKVKYRLVPFIW
jgi:protein-S-isoprenylcysteine O-methyltransferase Ste14